MGPRALVLRLLLDPDQLRVAVRRDRLPERVARERVQLLEAEDRRRGVAPLLAFRGEVVIDLAGAHEDARHAGRVHLLLRLDVRDDLAERA